MVLLKKIKRKKDQQSFEIEKFEDELNKIKLRNQGVLNKFGF
jgi:hypothetical protein